MKNRSVYPVFLILLGFAVLFSSGCNRKSGCAALDKTVKTDSKKKRSGNRDLFGRRY
ncbi:hypothetical protein [Lewinella sp. JB7]|uniref:hypothetical protein n=1 Tax=Lewinella sp. JB7 TaxID=2962887 RepID=UPI0020C9D274|nr:hypothetical protein [Lewinella sp. JB7]MCP9236959.1 hypothetical protein [Lewinella sp. JB7]